MVLSLPGWDGWFAGGCLPGRVTVWLAGCLSAWLDKLVAGCRVSWPAMYLSVFLLAERVSLPGWVSGGEEGWLAGWLAGWVILRFIYQWRAWLAFCLAPDEAT